MQVEDINNLLAEITSAGGVHAAFNTISDDPIVADLNPAELRAADDRAVTARTHLDEGRRVRALDRDNVGHVVVIDDTAGTCLVHVENDHGHNADTTMPWHELVVIDHPDAVTLTPAATATVTAFAATVADAEDDWAIELSAYGIEPGDADIYRRAVHVAVDRAAHQLCAIQPDWLTTWIGHRPGDAPGAAVWDDTTTRIAHYRLLHDIPESEPGIALRLVAPTLGRREERSLAEIDDDAIASDPVVRVQQHLRHLEDLAGRAATETEREAVTSQIDAARVALREARTQRTIDGVYARYMPDPTDDARRDRALTLAYDTLSDPPAWVVEHVRYLHDTGRLATTRLGDLTTRVVIAADHLDQHRQLPLGWPDVGLPVAERVVPEIELSLPSP